MTQRPILIVFIMLIMASQCALAAPMPRAAKEALKNAQECLAEDDLDGAEKECLKVLEHDPNSSIAYMFLGAIYTKRVGLEERAIYYYKRSLELDPSQVSACNNLASLYNQKGRFDDAVQCLLKGLERAPNDFTLNFNLGLNYLIGKQDAYKALEVFKRTYERDPDNAKVLYLLGLSYLLSGDRTRSLEFVTSLRKHQNEYLAAGLESIIRQFNRGTAVDVKDAMETVAKEPKKEAPRKAPGNPFARARAGGSRGVAAPQVVAEPQSITGTADVAVQARVRGEAQAEITIRPKE